MRTKTLNRCAYELRTVSGVARDGGTLKGAANKGPEGGKKIATLLVAGKNPTPTGHQKNSTPLPVDKKILPPGRQKNFTPRSTKNFAAEGGTYRSYATGW